jgi:lipopolysaccharide transport system permease protein
LSLKSSFVSLIKLSRYRGRLFEGVILDVKQQYTGSVLGVFWAILFPLLQLSIFAGLYTVIFKIRPSGLTEWEYVLLVFSGLVPLLAFTAAIVASSSSLSANKNLLLNTVFPAELIPLRSALSAHVPGLVGLFITLALGFILGKTSWQAIILVPIFWLLLLMFAIGLGWMLSLFSLVAKDIQHGIALVLMLVMILSPFAYTPEMVPSALKFIIYMNPLSYFVLSFQQLIAYGTWPDLVPAMGSAFLGLGSLVLGYAVFHRAKFAFFDYA